MNVMVNVWVYTSSLNDFLNGKKTGYLYPSEPRYQTQLMLPHVLLNFDNEEDNTCTKITANVSINE